MKRIKFLVVGVCLLLNASVFTQQQITGSGTGTTKISNKSNGSGGKNSVLVVESGPTVNSAQMFSVDGTKSASLSSATTPSLSVSRMDASNGTTSQQGSVQVMPTNTTISAEDDNSQHYANVGVGIDSIRIRSTDESTGTYSELKLKPNSISELVINGSMKTTTFKDWTKSETSVEDGTNVTMKVLNATYEEGSSTDGTTSSGYSMGSGAYSLYTANASGNTKLVLNPEDCNIGADDGGSNTSNTVFTPTTIVSTSTDGAKTTTQTVTAEFYELLSDSPGSNEQSITYKDAILINNYVADTEFSGGVVLSKDKLETTITEVATGNITTITSTPTESKTVNTQGTSIGTVRAGAESSYIENTATDKRSGVYGSSENILIESANTATGNTSSTNITPENSTSTSTDGTAVSTVAISPLSANMNSQNQPSNGINASVQVNSEDGFSKMMVSNSATSENSEITVKTNEVSTKVFGALVNSSMVQTGNNFTSTAEQFWIFTGATGYEQDGTSITITTTDMNVDGNLNPRNIMLSSGTTGRAPFRFSTGTNTTSPVNGALEFDGTKYSASAGSVRYELVKVLNGSASLDFPSTTTLSSSDLTITVTGASVNDPVSLGIPATAMADPACDYVAWVSATNTVTVRFNNYGVPSIDPGTATFTVTVKK